LKDIEIVQAQRDINLLIFCVE